MLIVKTPDGPAEHPDAETWLVSEGDERLVVLSAGEDPQVLAEYARGAWNAVRRDEVPVGS